MSISSDLSGKAFWEKEACRLEMKTPASWYGDRAKDSLPCGNGLTGLLCPGGIAAEQLLLTRHDLWHQVVRAPLPDISDVYKRQGEKFHPRMEKGVGKVGPDVHKAVVTAAPLHLFMLLLFLAEALDFLDAGQVVL